MAKKTIQQRMAEFSKEASLPKAPPVKVAPVKERGGTPEETALLGIRVPKSWPKALHIWALQHDTTTQAICNEILEPELKKRGII